MNGYEVTIAQSIYHNGVYSHTITRKIVVAANDRAEARELAQFELCGGGSYQTHELEIIRSQESIQHIRYLGRARVVTSVMYDHDAPESEEEEWAEK